MPSYRHPGVYNEETSKPRPVTAVPTSIAVFAGVCVRGPVNVPTLVQSWDDFERRFDGYDEDRTQWELAYAVRGFFDNGGEQAYINRLAHYTDLTDIAGIAVDPADTGTDIQSAGGTASAAQIVCAAGPYSLQNAESLVVNPDGAGNVTSTLAFTRAVLTGSVDLNGSPYTVAAGTEYLDIEVDDNGAVIRVAFTNAFGAYDNTEAAQAINNAVPGASVSWDGSNHLLLRSAKAGTGSKIEVKATSSVALLTGLGLTAISATGTGDAVDAAAVTATELAAALAPMAGITLSTSGGALVITSATTGGSSSLAVHSTSSASLLTELGLTSGQTAAGAAEATQHTYTAAAADVGTWGNDLSVTVVHTPLCPPLGAGLDLYANVLAAATSITMLHGDGISAGSVLFLDDGTNMEFAIVASVTRSVVGSVVRHVVTLSAPLTNGFLAADTEVGSIEYELRVLRGGVEQERWVQLSLNAAADRYGPTVVNDLVVGSQILRWTDEEASIGLGLNVPAEGTYALSGAADESASLSDADVFGDETGKTGLYALDVLDDAQILVVPGAGGRAATVQTILDYCAARQNMFAIFGPSTALTRDQARAYRMTTGGWDSSYGALYWPRVIVADPIGAGRDPVRTIDPSGHIAGAFARNDNVAPPKGGVWSTPAGFGDFGKLKGVRALETYATDRDQDVLNPVGVNVLRKFKGAGIVIFGGRTLSNDAAWRYIAVRRLFLFVEQSIKAATQGDVFRNNDFRTWGELKDRITKFLEDLWRQGAFPGRTVEQSFFVTIDESTTTPSDVDAGRLIGSIGIAPQKPAEFIVFRYSQLPSGQLQITE